MNVAVLGIGKMGSAIAKRLDSQGHHVILWNRTPARAEALGVGEIASTPRAAAEAADAVVSIVTDANAVRTVYLGSDGALAARGSKIYIDMSTVGSDVLADIADRDPDAPIVEAPVLGSPSSILSGTAVILVAGDARTIDRATPVLADLGQIRVVGQLGQAARLKLVANSMLAGCYALAAELFAVATAGGADREDAFFVLNRLVPALASRKVGFIDHQFAPVTFALRDLAKDLGLAVEVQRRLNADAPLTALTAGRFEEAARHAGEMEISAIATLYDREAPLGDKAAEPNAT